MFIQEPAIAAPNQTDFFGGALNVMFLIKILVLITSGYAIIKELSSRRSLLFIIGVLLTVAFFVSNYELNEMKNLGNGVKTFLKVHVKKLDGMEGDLTESTQKPNENIYQGEQKDKQNPE